MDQNSKEIPISHEFKITRLVEVNPRVEASAKKAISMVWNHHVGEPCNFNIIFCSHIFDPKTGEVINFSSEYDPDMDTFKFALETMRERMRLGLSDEETMILIAAHEAVHKVQFHRGDPPKPSRKTIEKGDEHYYDDRHEIEAWTEATHVFKKTFPNSSGGFNVGNRRYTIPKKSKY